MKTIAEQRVAAIRVINNIITLKTNVFNGCEADELELEEQSKRLEGIKNWAISNNQLPEIKNYFNSHNFGQRNQFAAAELSSYFNS